MGTKRLILNRLGGPKDRLRCQGPHPGDLAGSYGVKSDEVSVRRAVYDGVGWYRKTEDPESTEHSAFAILPASEKGGGGGGREARKAGR